MLVLLGCSAKNSTTINLITDTATTTTTPNTTIGLTDLIYPSYYNSLPSGLNYQLCTEDGTMIMDESDWTNQINLNSGNYYIKIQVESGNEALVSFSYTIVDE